MPRASDNGSAGTRTFNMKIHFFLAAVAALALTGSAIAATIDEDDPNYAAYEETELSIPMKDADGEEMELSGKLCVPSDAEGKARLVIINHGSPAKASDRPTMQLGDCDSEVAQWFLSRGLAVLYALRRGYGDTGGEWAEQYGPCDDPDYARAGLESARDIGAMVAFATRQPGVRPDGVIIAGVSAGGWATMAYDSVPHPKAIAFINMAGGRGGHRNGQPNANCHPERLADAAAIFGRTARTPMLWVYAQNDTYFRPEIARAMYQAFARSGGKAEFHALGPNGGEGHYLWSADGGSEVWGPLVEAYLRKMGALDQADSRD